MKARYVAGLLDGCLHLSIASDSVVRARLVTCSKAVYDALCAVIGADDFKRVVITKRVTLSSAADGSSKVNKKITYTIDLDEEQTFSTLTLAAAKSVLVRHAAQAALDGDIPLLQAAIKRLEAPARPRKAAAAADAEAPTGSDPAAPIEVDRSMLTPAWLSGYIDSVGTSEIRRGRSAVKVAFPATPGGQELQKAFVHAFQTPDNEGDMCTSQQHTVVFSGDLHPAHALNVLGAPLNIMRKAFEEAATPPPPKTRAPRLPKKRTVDAAVDDENSDPKIPSSAGRKKNKTAGPPLGKDTPPPPSNTQEEVGDLSVA